MRLDVFELWFLFFRRYPTDTSLLFLGCLSGLSPDVEILDGQLHAIGGGSFQVMKSVGVGLLVRDHCFEDRRLRRLTAHLQEARKGPGGACHPKVQLIKFTHGVIPRRTQ